MTTDELPTEPRLVARVRRFLATKRARGVDADAAVALVRIARSVESDRVGAPGFQVRGRDGPLPPVVALHWQGDTRGGEHPSLDLVVAGWDDARRRPIASYVAAVVNEDRMEATIVGDGDLGDGAPDNPVGWVEEARRLLDWCHRYTAFGLDGPRTEDPDPGIG